MTIRNLIFDLDGTLIDSSRGVIEAVNYALVQMGQPPRPAEAIKKYIGYPLHQMFADFTSAPADELYAHFQVKAAETVVVSAEPLAGVDATLYELTRRGYSLAIATTKTRAHLDGIVAKLGWTRLFRATISGSDVARPKPDPAAFRLALGRLGCSSDTAIVVGDTINDILAARAIPMKVASVPCPYSDGDEVASLHPDYMLASLAELLNIFE